jgi:hypothetical protein
MLDNTRCGLAMDLIMVGKSVLQKWRSSINIVLPIYSKKAEILKSGYNMTGKARCPPPPPKPVIVDGLKK